MAAGLTSISALSAIVALQAASPTIALPVTGSAPPTESKAVPAATPNIPKSTAALGAEGRIPVLIVSGSDTFHDWRRTTPQLRSLLEESGRFDVRVVEDAEALSDEKVTRRYRTIVLNGQVATSSRRLRAKLTRYVRGGGGLVAIHWAIDNFHDWPSFTNLLGRSWQEGASVEEHGSFHVVPNAGYHPILRGLPAWDTPTSEAIHYRLRGTEPIDVLATARSLKSPELAAVAFSHAYGRGRTFFTPLGHNLAARSDPNWQVMIVRAVEWTATGRIVAAPPIG